MSDVYTLAFSREQLQALQSALSLGGDIPNHAAHLRWQQRNAVDTGHEISLGRELAALESGLQTIMRA